MKTYRLSAAGRRLTLVMLGTALLIWAFALWSLISTVQSNYQPGQPWPNLQQSLAASLGAVPSLLMLGLIIATPLLLWNLLEEWAAAYTPTPEGLRFASLGVKLTYPWAAITAVRRVDEDADEPLDELLLDGDYSSQIANPVVRFLHRQAYGATKLPIYPGLEDRDGLLEEIRRQCALPAPGAGPATATV